MKSPKLKAILTGTIAALLLVSCNEDPAGSSSSDKESDGNPITLIGYESGSTTSERTLDIQGVTASARGDNGTVTVYNSMGTTQANLTVYSGAYSQTIETANGDNVITVTIYEGSSQVESATTKVRSTAPKTPARVRLTWDTPDNDVDLYVVTPSGDTCYYSNKTVSAGYLDIDDTDGYGPETFSVTNAESGKYVIGLNYYDDDGITSTVNATLKVSFNDNPWQDAGTTTYSQSDADGGSVIRPISEFTL